tara:strand:- start:2168 stop:3745 length:1578 start_codon:yes stop_codon:yes gene_type:complete
MATNFSDIMSNYQDMSVEELGTSLLARQEQQRAEVAKAAKKNRKVEQALGVLLAGQAVFKTAFNRRQEELKELKTLDLLNAENDTKKINALSSFVSIIPDNYMVDKPLEERVTSFINNPELYNQFKVKSKTFIDSYLKPTMKNNPNFEFSPEYESLTKFGNKALITSLLENNNYQTFTKELQELEPSEMTKEDLFKKYIRINPKEFTQQRTRQYNQLENNFREKAGLIGGLKQIVQLVSKDKNEEGELNLYKNLTEQDIAGSDLNTILNTIDIGGVLLPELDKAMAAIQMSPKKYRSIMSTERGAALVNRLDTEEFTSLVNELTIRDVSPDKLVNTGGLLDEVDISKIEGVFTFINKNVDIKKEVLKDAGALSLRFQEDPQFAIDLYKSLTNDSNKINEFKNRIEDTEFRNKYAIMMTVKMGIKGIGPVFADPIGRTPKYQGYDRNPMTLLIDDVFSIKNGNFKASTDYYFLNDEQKKLMVDKKIKSILGSPISQAAKQTTIDNFVANIDIPGFTNIEDYIKTLI